MLLSALLAALATPALAADYSEETNQPMGYGVGVIVGVPTGLSFARRQEQTTIDAAVAWDFREGRRLHVHADYLLTVYTFQDPLMPEVSFPLYVGAGPRMQLDVAAEGLDLGVRIPVGMNIVATELELPLDGFIELAPVVGLYPSTRFRLDAAIGIRFFLF
jgi:hypothetical protein